MANKLLHETSLYLQQHAQNPVQWYPWGPEALKLAKDQDKPILVSIGYSSCHWCHVMAHECFENDDIAKLQNELFINIKIDREERPDLDEIYMSAVQMITGRGGWPLNVFLTPDLVPFYGGTYFPPQSRHTLPSWPTVLVKIAEFYRNNRTEVEKTKSEIYTQIQSLSNAAGKNSETLTGEIVAMLRSQLRNAFDKAYGGFGMPPKFPHCGDLHFLLSDPKYTQDVEMSLFTLEKMAQGGICDQLGGGFHRYSTDEKWLIPHFEKMLYDNALLLRVYAEAQQVEVVKQIGTYIKNEMTHPEGAFFSSQDADSEGEEGRYYVWTRAEIEKHLSKKDAELFCDYYGVTQEGNFENSASALHVTHKNISESEKKSLEASRQKLLVIRQKRVAPHTDQKIVLAWNGLMMGALARAGFIDMAVKAKNFIFEKMFDGKEFSRIYNEKTKTPAFLDDYSYLCASLIDLFEASGDRQVLSQAVQVLELTLKYFGDVSGAFYFTREGQSDVITRSSSCFDSSTPSPQSVMVMNLLRLGKISRNQPWLDRAEQSLKYYQPLMQRAPRACVELVTALDFFLSEDLTSAFMCTGGVCERPTKNPKKLA